MSLHNLSSTNKKNKKRLGRGPGSTLGKTSGRGHKGQKSRSGGGVRRGFEGGQTPLHRRLPKFGFTNCSRVEYQIVNLETLEKSEKVSTGDELTKEKMVDLGLIRTSRQPVKLLGNGELTKSVKLEADKASQSAMEKLQAAGGSLLA